MCKDDVKFHLFDLHVDSIISQRLFRYDVSKRHRAGLRGQPLFWHADLPRMREAGYSAACMGIHYFPWESERGWKELGRQIDYLDKIAAQSDCVRVRSAKDWRKGKEQGRLALAPGIEGAHMLNGRLDRVAKLARYGVAYLTLTHFSRNFAATPSMGIGANRRDGLTEFGRRLVRELNRFGIAVDVAHVNTPGVLEACRQSQAPVLCSHCGVKGICDVPRNISDAEIEAIANTGGVIGIMFAPIFLAGKLRASTEIILDHIEYLVEHAGISHVALGSDYDGWLPTIACDQRDCRDIALITRGLFTRGYPAKDIASILGDNVLRVLEKSWELREVE